MEEMKKFESLPLVINTIENCYESICIAGNNDQAEILYDYFANNKNLKLSRVKIESEKYVEVIDDTELVIITERASDIVFKKCNGKNVYCIYYDKLKDCEITPFDDIYNNIIPYLINNRVRVIVVKTPNLLLYRPLFRLLCSMFFWNYIQKNFKNRDRFLLRHYGEEYLYDDFTQTKADKSKGYLKVYGNGKYINYDDGFRRVPSKYKYQNGTNHVYMFGFCISANPMLNDEETIAANVQVALNNSFRVLSRGNDGSSINLIIRETPFRKGDVVVLFTSHHDVKADVSGAEIIQLADEYFRVSRLWKHIADNAFHCDAFIAKRIANTISKIVTKNVDYEKDKYNKDELIMFGGIHKKTPLLSMLNIEIKEYVDWIKKEMDKITPGGGTMVPL